MPGLEGSGSRAVREEFPVATGGRRRGLVLTRAEHTDYPCHGSPGRRGKEQSKEKKDEARKRELRAAAGKARSKEQAGQ